MPEVARGRKGAGVSDSGQTGASVVQLGSREVAGPVVARVLTSTVAGTAPVFLTGFVTNQGLSMGAVK